MKTVLALSVVCLAATGARAQDPDADADVEDLSPAPAAFSNSVQQSAELDRFGLAATATGSLSLWGFPMAGLGVGIAGRIRVLDWVSIEPHADALVESFIMIGVGSLQLGVPFVVEGPLQDGMRTHIGVGPFLTAGHVFGHDSLALGTFVGGEIVGGVGIPLNDVLEGRAQLRGHLAFGGAAPLAVNLGGSGTAGIMLTF